MAKITSQNPGLMPVISLAKDGEALCNQQKTISGADCGSDHHLLVAKFGLKLKKVGKTSFRYDLNKIIYDYTYGGENRFKRLDLVDRQSEELWTEFCDIPQ